MNSSSWLFASLMTCLTAAGCGPASQPIWNNDSRSFIYTQPDGAVVQYDLEKNAARTLFAANDHHIRLSTLNPMSDTIAFAPAAVGPESRAVQVGLASLVKGNLTWSKTSVWGDPDAKRDNCSSSCYWCPTGRRILIWYQQPGEIPGTVQSGTPAGRFAVFDIKSQMLSELTTVPPAVMLAQFLNISPLCPDGSGYVAMKVVDKKPKLFFVSWDGWEYPLTIEEKVAAFLNSMEDPQLPKEKLMQMFLPLPQGRWAENVLRFSLRAGTIAIDLKNRRITLVPLTAIQQQELDQIAKRDAEDTPWSTIQVAPFQGDEFELHFRQKMGDNDLPARIELVDKKLHGRRILLEGFLRLHLMAHHLFPSPDGKLILACLREDQTNKSWIHVLQSDGKVLTKLEAGPVIAGGLLP